MKYIKRSVQVEAIQLTWENWSDVCNLVPRQYFVGGVYLNEKLEMRGEGSHDHIGLLVKTIDGNEVLIKEGDYVVIDAKGAPYPCDKEIFEMNHEPV